MGSSFYGCGMIGLYQIIDLCSSLYFVVQASPLIGWGCNNPILLKNRYLKKVIYKKVLFA